MIARNFEVRPAFHDGFLFLWQLDRTTKIEPPWTFIVEESKDGRDGTFKAISPELENLFQFQEDGRKEFTKDPDLFFRLRTKSAGRPDEVSEALTYMGTLDLQTFLYVKEIQRKELLQMQNMAAVPIDVYRKMKTGISCTFCIDPITEDIRDPNCPTCNGTRFVGGYHGPYRTFGTFSTTKVHKKHAEGGAGVDDDRIHVVRMIGNPLMVRDDIIVDIKGDRRYTVDEIDYELELRRIPVIQNVKTHENERDQIIHALGEEVSNAS